MFPHLSQLLSPKNYREWDGGCVHPTPVPLGCFLLLKHCPSPLGPTLGFSPLGTPCFCGAPHGHSSFRKCPPDVVWALPVWQVRICSRWALWGCRRIPAVGLEPLLPSSLGLGPLFCFSLTRILLLSLYPLCPSCHLWLKAVCDGICRQAYCWGGQSLSCALESPQVLPGLFYLLQHVVPSEAGSSGDVRLQPVMSLTRIDSHLIAVLAVSLLAETLIRRRGTSRKTSLQLPLPMSRGISAVQYFFPSSLLVVPALWFTGSWSGQ